jgi:hypothetical protein
MVPLKSLDEFEIIAATLRDVSETHGLVFNTRSLKLTLCKVNSRLRHEGLGFLTKTLPRLGKALEKALTGVEPLSAIKSGFDPLPGSELPRFLGELFQLVLRPDGTALGDPCAQCVKDIRQITYCFNKYELPYTDEQEQKVIAAFERTEQELVSTDRLLPTQEDLAAYAGDIRLRRLQSLRNGGGEIPLPFSLPSTNDECQLVLDRYKRLYIARGARRLLRRLFAHFDPYNIHPKHGPGAVSTKEKLETKYQWTNVSDRITDVYPFDAYFCASQGHVCDTYSDFSEIGGVSNSARVVLVPKDSRGPRLISCEPVDNQWIQQGLGRAIVELVEKHPDTECQVNFTFQSSNRTAALYGSENGRYATLDLKEASDRVSLELVRLLFPQDLQRFLECCRSTSTVLPDGRVLELRKFAPMGSCLCFPILALTVFSILYAGAPDAGTRERILVYGDDVIVPTAYAGDAMVLLELFGLKVNRDKSCIGGLFRESCGMDAFKGSDVTPVRLRTVLTNHQSPDILSSYVAFANMMYDRKRYRVYDKIVEWLVSIYGPIPDQSLHLACPSLRNAPDYKRPLLSRWNKRLQKRQYLVWDVGSPSCHRPMDGWSQLLRFFAESGSERPLAARSEVEEVDQAPWSVFALREAFSVGKYTTRRNSCLLRRWR